MNKFPLVTIICICYNHEKYVVQALNSIVAQNYKSLEIIILDDCSTDNSVIEIKKWAAQHKVHQLIINSENLGITKSFNKALTYANGDYIMDLAADDYLETAAISTLISVFIENVDTALAYGNTKLVDENDQFIEYYYHNSDEAKSGDIYKDIIGQTLKINSVASMIKTKVLKELGGYDERLLFEDLDIWVRLSRSCQITYVDHIIINKRMLSSSLGSQFVNPFNKFTKQLNRTVFSILKKAYLLNRNIEENKSLLLRVRKELKKSIKNYDFTLTIKYLFLEFALRFNLNLR
jgi:glycosyltransferase involved in cell wall biosynthesis